MAKIELLDKDGTRLSEYGLTYDRIMEGRRAELEAEKRTKMREKYVLQDSVNEIIAAYADDLLESYEVIEEMEVLIEDKDEQLIEAKEAFDKSQEQVKTVLNGADTMDDVEMAMEELDRQMTQLSEASKMSKKEAEELRQELQLRLNELEEERARIDGLSQDVSDVLSNLEIYLDEEGIIME